MNTAETVKIFLLGMIVAFLAILALRSPETEAMGATGGAGAAAADLIAVTGDATSCLYLIDPINKYIAQYQTDNARFSLRAARYFKHDLYIKDKSVKGGISVDDAKKFAKESMEAKDDDK